MCLLSLRVTGKGAVMLFLSLTSAAVLKSLAAPLPGKNTAKEKCGQGVKMRDIVHTHLSRAGEGEGREI